MTYPASTTVVTLSRPFTVKGVPVTEIEMREPTVRDRLMLSKGKGDAAEKELSMIASLCGLEVIELMLLPGYDYDQLLEALNVFFLPPDQRASKDLSTTNQE